MDKRRTKVATLDQIWEGGTLLVESGGEPICLYNLQGRIHATQDLCTHGSASLSEGIVEGDRIQCPLHQGEFHIPSGKACAVPCSVDLKTYRVEVEESDVYIVDAVTAEPPLA
jgi:ethylbenzene dioxygenase ferredoxin component